MDSNNTIVKTYPTFNIDNIIIDPPTTTKTGNKYFNFKFPNSEDWLLQTPTGKLVYSPEYSITLCVRTHDFEEFINTFDMLIVKSVSKYLNKTEDDVWDIYRPLLKSDGYGENAVSYIRVNINGKTKSSKGTEFFDKIGNVLIKHETINSLKTSDKIKCLIRFKKIQLKKKNEEWALSVQTDLCQVMVESMIINSGCLIKSVGI